MAGLFAQTRVNFATEISLRLWAGNNGFLSCSRIARMGGAFLDKAGDQISHHLCQNCLFLSPPCFYTPSLQIVRRRISAPGINLAPLSSLRSEKLSTCALSKWRHYTLPCPLGLPIKPTHLGPSSELFAGAKDAGARIGVPPYPYSLA